MFCASGLIFGGTKGANSRFNVLRSVTHFGQYRGRQVQFSFFALPNSFSAVPRVPDPVFMFCALGLVFDGTEALGLICMFCAPGHVIGSTEGIWPRFHVLRSRTYFGRYRGVMSSFHVLRSRTRLGWFLGRRVPYSCIALLDSFSAIPRVSIPIFMFCASKLIFGGTEGIGSYFHVLRSQTHFRRYQGRQVLFSCLALPNSFSTVPKAPGPVFMFCAPSLFFGGTESVGSHFHFLRSGTRLGLYRGR
jgi:hypothetical protein